jgi:hypothetical protein
MRTLVTLEPATLVVAPDPPVRWLRSLQRACFRLVTWRGFDAAVSGIIVANIVFMMLKHAGQSQAYIDAITISNAIFTALFGIEALLKVRPWEGQVPYRAEPITPPPPSNGSLPADRWPRPAAVLFLAVE